MKRNDDPRLHARAVSDAFGYVCSVEQAAFQEAATATDADRRRRVAGGAAAVHVQVLRHGLHHGVRVDERQPELPRARTRRTNNVAIPVTGNPNAAIYAFWDDLIVDAAASVRTELLGAAPNRRFVVEWRNVHFFGDTTRRIDVNVVLHENGRIVTQTRNLADDGRERGDSATIGIENAGRRRSESGSGSTSRCSDPGRRSTRSSTSRPPSAKRHARPEGPARAGPSVCVLSRSRRRSG